MHSMGTVTACAAWQPFEMHAGALRAVLWCAVPAHGVDAVAVVQRLVSCVCDCATMQVTVCSCVKHQPACSVTKQAWVYIHTAHFNRVLTAARRAVLRCAVLLTYRSHPALQAAAIHTPAAEQNDSPGWCPTAVHALRLCPATVQAHS
eukprot:jgi/Ulvmu1/3801/UM018_0011.1